MGVLSCPLKFSFGECQRWSKSHLCCRGKEKAEIFVWKSNLEPRWKGRRSSSWYLFENPILMQQQHPPPVRMKRFKMDSCTLAKYQKTFATLICLSFLKIKKNIWINLVKMKRWKRDGLKWSDVRICFSLYPEKNLSCWSILNTFCFHISAKVGDWWKCKITIVAPVLKRVERVADDSGDLFFSPEENLPLPRRRRRTREGFDEYLMLFSPSRLQMFPWRGVAVSTFRFSLFRFLHFFLFGAFGCSF